MLLKKYMILLLMLPALQSNCQDSAYLKTRQDSVKALLKVLRNHNSFESAHIDFAAEPSWQYYRFAVLDKLSTDNELVVLTNDSAACVRVYSFAALLQRNYKNIEGIRKRLLADSAALTTQITCIEDHTTVGNFIATGHVEKIYRHNEKNSFLKMYYTNTKYAALIFNRFINTSEKPYFK